MCHENISVAKKVGPGKIPVAILYIFFFTLKVTDFCVRTTEYLIAVSPLILFHKHT